MRTGFNALSGFKPITPSSDYPVLLVNTFYNHLCKKLQTQVLFSSASDVDECVADLVKLKPTKKHTQWILATEHPDQQTALTYSVRVNQAFHVLEYQPMQGVKLYTEFYEKYCPDDLRAKPMSGPSRKAKKGLG